LEFERAQTPLSLVVVERDGQVIEEGQYRLVSQEQSRHQVARRRLPELPALARAANWRGIGGQSGREEGVIARVEGAV
jgi:hypothetical protein